MGKKRNDEWAGIAHMRTPLEVMDSPAWRVLGWPARALYHDLRAKLRQNNNGNINATLLEMKHCGWRSSATLARALRQLETMGFIAKTRQGGIAAFSRFCTLYRFTDLQVFEWPKLGIGPLAPTHDYRQFQSVKEAKAHLRDKKTKVQEMNLIASGNEPMKVQEMNKRDVKGSGNEQGKWRQNPTTTKGCAGMFNQADYFIK